MNMGWGSESLVSICIYVRLTLVEENAQSDPEARADEVGHDRRLVEGAVERAYLYPIKCKAERSVSVASVEAPYLGGHLPYTLAHAHTHVLNRSALNHHYLSAPYLTEVPADEQRVLLDLLGVLHLGAWGPADPQGQTLLERGDRRGSRGRERGRRCGGVWVWVGGGRKVKSLPTVASN